MASPQKKCGCKGSRSCLLCESTRPPQISPTGESVLNLFQCQQCGRLFQRNLSAGFTCTTDCLSGDSRTEFSGVTVVKGFIDENHERTLIEEIDKSGWAESQSGRRKQDYGPKVNFKRQKVQLGLFDGLPPFIEPILSRMNSEVTALKDFVPVELCCLDYRPERGAAIDPHTDDSWVWGERLVTLNLLSNTTLTFSAPYNTQANYTNSPAGKGDLTPSHEATPQSLKPPPSTVEVEVFLPRLSLIIVEGVARHSWQHSIKREHITSRRVAITLRELAGDFLPGGCLEATGRGILDRASHFTGHPINLNRTVT